MEEHKSNMPTGDFWYGIGARAGRFVSRLLPNRWKRLLGRSSEPPSSDQFLDLFHRALRNIRLSSEVDSNEFRRLLGFARK